MSLIEKIYNTLSTQIHTFNETLVSFIKIIVRSKNTPNPPLATNSTCFILGNGPSLKTSLNKHFELLKQNDNDIICVNHFSQSEYFELLKPKHYILLDNLYFFFNEKEDYWSEIKATFDKFKTVNWEMTIHIPLIAKKSQLVTTYLHSNPNIKINYFNYVVVSGYDWFKFFIYKKGLGMPQCQNVLGATIFTSINAGYKHIYLLGADHSWHEQISVFQDNSISINDKHFYDKNDGTKVVLTKARHKDTTISHLFLSLYKTFKGYYILNSYSKYRGCNIFNASETSYIDGFERKPL